MSQSIGFVNLELEPITNPGQLTTIRYDEFVRTLLKKESHRDMLFHVALGVCGEAGELADAIKKHLVYNKPLDRDNIVEELGDLRFFIQGVMNLLNVSETEILQTNGYKLSKRYAGLHYSDGAAQARVDKIGTEEK